MTSRKLTEKENVFVSEYIRNGFVASAAYRVAYPNASESTIASTACLVTQRPHVRAEINKRMKDELGDLDELADKALHKLSIIAFAQKGDEDYNASNQLKALELIQKQLGLQTQNMKTDINSAQGIEINILGDMDD